MNPITIITQQFDEEDSRIVIEDECILALQLYNTGDSDCYIDSYLLEAGNSLCLPYLQGFYYSQNISLRWADTTQTCKIQVVMQTNKT